jgi:hypothetical protein
MTSPSRRSVVLERVTDNIEAFGLVSFLSAQGIPVSLRYSPLSAAMGDIPFAEAATEVVLEDPSRMAEAKEWVERYWSGYFGIRGTAWVCVCGEAHEPQFGACWRCGSLKGHNAPATGSGGGLKKPRGAPRNTGPTKPPSGTRKSSRLGPRRSP